MYLIKRNKKGKASGVPYRTFDNLVNIFIALLAFDVISYICFFNACSNSDYKWIDILFWISTIGVIVLVLYVIIINVFFAYKSKLSFWEYIKADLF